MLLVAAGALAVFLATSDDEAAAAEFEREPIETAGDNPFMPNVGADEDDVTPPDDTGGTFEGDTPGLYGGTMDAASCDAEQLVTFLEAEPDKAAAWADVLEIQPEDIRDFVDRLTPVVLRSDTYVTNHGFRDGRARSFPAVLQAGTAVLVDERGAPVVKCYCGNPLTAPPSTADVEYRGPRWPAFEPANIIVIQTANVNIDVFTVIDLATNEAFGRPAGTDGSEDGPAPDTDIDEPATTTTTTDSDIPTDATYDIDITLSEICQGGGGTYTSTASVAGGQVTIHFGEPGEADATVSGPVNPDGTFTFDATFTLTSWRIEGRLDAATLTATGEEVGDPCTFTIDGTRTP